VKEKRRRANKKQQPRSRSAKIDLDQLYARMDEENMDAILRAAQKAQPPEAHVVN